MRLNGRATVPTDHHKIHLRGNVNRSQQPHFDRNDKHEQNFTARIEQRVQDDQGQDRSGGSNHEVLMSAGTIEDRPAQRAENSRR